jgi:hypothetical protein
MEEEEEEDQYVPIYRTDGHWYYYAFTILGKFVNKLKAGIVCDERKLPSDLQKPLAEQADKTLIEKYIPMEEKLRLLREFNTFINLQLREQLAQHGIPYDDTDIYLNVVNLAKAKGINLLDPKIVRDEVLPWLGTTNWSSNTGGQTEQVRRINKIIKTIHKGGIYNRKFKKSRKNQKLFKKGLLSRKRNQNRSKKL